MIKANPDTTESQVSHTFLYHKNIHRYMNPQMISNDGYMKFVSTPEAG